MKIDINDVFALVGGVMIASGTTYKFGWEMAVIVLGCISLFLGVWRAK